MNIIIVYNEPILSQKPYGVPLDFNSVLTILSQGSRVSPRTYVLFVLGLFCPTKVQFRFWPRYPTHLQEVGVRRCMYIHDVCRPMLLVILLGYTLGFDSVLGCTLGFDSVLGRRMLFLY